MGLVLSHTLTTERRGVNIYQIKDRRTRIAELRITSFKKTLDGEIIEFDFTNFINGKKECKHYDLRKRGRVTPMKDLTVSFQDCHMEKFGTLSLRFLYEAPLEYIIVRSEIDKVL